MRRTSIEPNNSLFCEAFSHRSTDVPRGTFVNTFHVERPPFADGDAVSPGEEFCGPHEMFATVESREPSFEEGVLLGVLLSAGHFGGDRRSAHVTVKLHVRHEKLLRWLFDRWPMGRLYGPYEHGGRTYLQLMFRGDALTRRLVPLLDALPWAEIDDHSYERYLAMKRRYELFDD